MCVSLSASRPPSVSPVKRMVVLEEVVQYLSMLLSVIPFGGPPCSDPFRSFFPGRLLRPHTRPLSQKYGEEEARKSRNGGNGPGYRTQYFSPLSDGVASSPYWALMNLPHSSKCCKR